MRIRRYIKGDAMIKSIPNISVWTLASLKRGSTLDQVDKLHPFPLVGFITTYSLLGR